MNSNSIKKLLNQHNVSRLFIFHKFTHNTNKDFEISISTHVFVWTSFPLWHGKGGSVGDHRVSNC
jgi:hypothetical protein